MTVTQKKEKEVKNKFKKKKKRRVWVWFTGVEDMQLLLYLANTVRSVRHGCLEKERAIIQAMRSHVEQLK